MGQEFIAQPGGGKYRSAKKRLNSKLGGFRGF